MAKGQTNAATGASQTLINQANKQMPGVISGLQAAEAASQAQANESYNQAYSGYQQQQQTGGFNPTQLSGIRNELTGWAPSGAYDPQQLTQILQGYGNLATTGGYTPQMMQEMVNQATSGTTTTASNLSSAAQRAAAAGGGNAQAAIANIQQQLGPQQAQAAQQARLGVQQAQIQNQLAGLGGLGTTEQQLASARQGVAGLQSGLESSVAQGVQAANAGMAGLYNTATGQVTAQGQQVLQALGLQYGTEAQGAQILQELSKNPGLFQTGFGDLTSLLGSLP